MASDRPRNRPHSSQDSANGAGRPSPTGLDRRRLDSDVRALLRQPSTPWITFDRASRASHVGLGELLPARASVILPDGFEAVPSRVEASAIEPSTMTVSSDLAGADASVATGETPVVADAPPADRRSARPRFFAMAACLVAAAAAFVLVHRAPAAPSGSAAAKASAPVARELTPPDLAAQMADVTHVSPAPDAQPMGKVVIRGAARRAPVFVDGQRLAGSGGRTVAVACGMHMIGVGSKAKASRFTVPCNGEIVITR